MIIRIVMYCILSLLIISCGKQTHTEPVYTQAKKLSDKDTQYANQPCQNEAMHIMDKQFDLQQITNRHDKQKIKDAIRQGIAFLYCTFGQPIVEQKVVIELNTKRPNLIALMQWKLKSIERKIIINPKEMDRKSVFDRTIVHELFHALYQSNNFFINNRDFITEGMAAYAENSFRFFDNDTAALDYLGDRVVAISRATKTCFNLDAKLNTSDMNKDFDEHERNQVDAMYALSAYYWFALKADINVNEKIYYILNLYKGNKIKHVLESKNSLTLYQFQKWYGIHYDFSKHSPYGSKRPEWCL